VQLVAVAEEEALAELVLEGVVGVQLVVVVEVFDREHIAEQLTPVQLLGDCHADRAAILGFD